MKKILLLTDNAFTYSGREKIMAMMSRIYSKDNEVSIFSLKGKLPLHYDFGSINEVITFDGERFKFLKTIKRINSGRFDFIFIVSMGKLSVIYSSLSFILNGKSKPKLIACEHVSLESLSYSKRLLKHLAFKYYDKVVLLTKRDEEKVNSFSDNGVVIYNPLFYKDEVKMTRSYCALAVGRLVEQKNFLEMIDIWEEFSQKNSHWILYILGDGEQQDEIQKKIYEKKLSDKVILKGKVDNIEDYYRDCDVCLMTSKYEGLPLALLEAKSHSMPCIAYDCPTGPSEIISHGIDGYLIKMHDKKDFVSKIEAISKDDVTFFQFSSNTKKTAKKFHFEEIKKKWMSLID